MKKEYLTFVEDIKDLAEGKEIEITIRDLTPGPRKYDAKIVKAIVSKSPSVLPDGDILRVWSRVGFPYSEPWAIGVIGEVSETLAGIPHGDFIKASRGQ